MKKIIITEKQLQKIILLETKEGVSDTIQPNVQSIQKFLISVGILPEKNAKGESNVDGIPGDETAKAVGKFLMGTNTNIRTVEDLRKILVEFNKTMEGVPSPGVKSGWGDLMNIAVSTAISIKQKGTSFFIENEEIFKEYVNDKKFNDLIIKLINQKLPGNYNNKNQLNSSENLYDKSFSTPVGIHKCDDCPLCGWATFNKNPCNLGFLNSTFKVDLNNLTILNLDTNDVKANIEIYASVYVKSPWNIFQNIRVNTNSNMGYNVSEDENNYHLDFTIKSIENTETSWENVGVGYLRLYKNKIQYKNKTIDKMINGVNQALSKIGSDVKLPKMVLSSGWFNIKKRIEEYLNEVKITINKEEIEDISKTTPYNPSKSEKDTLKNKLKKSVKTKVTGKPTPPPTKNVFRTLYNTNTKSSESGIDRKS
mgnify:FL=1